MRRWRIERAFEFAGIAGQHQDPLTACVGSITLVAEDRTCGPSHPHGTRMRGPRRQNLQSDVEFGPVSLDSPSLSAAALHGLSQAAVWGLGQAGPEGAWGVKSEGERAFLTLFSI